MSKRSYERRLRAKRAAQKAERMHAARMRKLRVGGSIAAGVALAVVLLIVVLNAGGGPKPTATGTHSPVPGCDTASAAPSPSSKTFPSAPAMSIDTNKIYVATINTNCGTFTIRMDPKTAPKTVNNFVFLARQGFYNGVSFHRIEDQLNSYAIIQGGDPKGNGSGDPGYSYDGETPAPTATYPKGTVAMANSQGPSTNGSQFFVVVRDWPGLPPSYTIFGTITDEAASFTTLNRIVSLKSPTESKPSTPIYMITVTIAEQART